MSIGSALSGFRLREFSDNVKSFFLYGVLINAGMALFSLLFNLYLLRLSFQEDFIGQVAGMAPLASGILALPAGMLSDRFGHKPFLVASGLLLATSQLGLCYVTTPGALLAFSFVGGIGSAFIWVNHVPFLSDNAQPSRRAEALVI
jgi:MFS family permease